MFNAYKNLATETQAYETLRTAQMHAETTTKSGKSSAVSCVKDADGFFNEGRFGFAHEWAVESLRHSIGILHADFGPASTNAKRDV